MTYDIHSVGGTSGTSGNHEGPRPFSGIDLPSRSTRLQRLMALSVGILAVLLILGVALIALSLYLKNADRSQAHDEHQDEYAASAEADAQADADAPGEVESAFPAETSKGRVVTNYVQRAVSVEMVVDVPVTNVVVKPYVVVVEVPVTNVVVRPYELTIDYPVTNVVVRPFQVVVDQVVTNYVRLGAAVDDEDVRPALHGTGTFSVAPAVPVGAPHATAVRADSAQSEDDAPETVAVAQPVPVRRPIRTMTPYRLRWGDTVTKLAVRYSFRIPDFLICNPGVDMEHVRAGQVIQLPGDVTIESESNEQ